MTNTIVAQPTITEEAVDLLKAQWEAACDAERAAWATNDLVAVKAASVAERAANAAWKAGERALVARYSADVAADEEARLHAMCEAHDAMEEDYGAFDDHAYYTLTTAGMSYLDHHYHTASEAGMLAAGGESPYGDGTTGWVQPTPAHPCYVNGVADMDALSRYEDLSY